MAPGGRRIPAAHPGCDRGRLTRAATAESMTSRCKLFNDEGQVFNLSRQKSWRRLKPVPQGGLPAIWSETLKGLARPRPIGPSPLDCSKFLGREKLMNSRKNPSVLVSNDIAGELRRIFRHNACQGGLSAAAPVRGGRWLCLLGAGKARDGAGQEVRRGPPGSTD